MVGMPVKGTINLKLRVIKSINDNHCSLQSWAFNTTLCTHSGEEIAVLGRGDIGGAPTLSARANKDDTSS